MPKKLSGSFTDILQSYTDKEGYEDFIKVNNEGYKTVIENDLPRSRLVDFSGKTFADFKNECLQESVYKNHYRQGCFDGGLVEDIFLLYLNKTEMQRENFNPERLKRTTLRFAYRDKNNQICTLGLVIPENSPGEWSLMVIQNATAPLDKRQATLLYNNSWIEDNNSVIAVESHNSLNQELRQALNNDDVYNLVTGIIDQNNEVSSEKLRELKGRISENQNIDNRDFKNTILRQYREFSDQNLPNNSSVKSTFETLEKTIQEDIDFYRDDKFSKALETIHRTIHEEINQLEDKEAAKELSLKSQLFYYSLNLRLEENFSSRIKKALEDKSKGDELKRVFNKLPINDPGFEQYISDFFNRQIKDSQISYETQIKIIEKTTQDRGRKSQTQEAETGSIFDKNGKLAPWVADELPENSRDAIGQFIKNIFAKARETVLTPEGELRKELKDAMGQENYNKLVDMYGKDYVHNKVVNSMIMAMSGPLTSLPLQSNPSAADMAFAAITSKLLDHERLYQQKQLKESELKQSENQPGRLMQFWQAVKRPALETAAIATSTAGGAAVGAIVGMLVGTFALPGIGTGLGAAIGAAAGAGVGAVASTGGVGLSRLFSNSPLGRLFGTAATTVASTGIGAAIGAALGTFVFPGIGTGIGAAIGAGFGLATGVGISGVAQAIKSQSAFAKLLGVGLTGSATTAIGAGIGAILGSLIPIPGVGTLAGILIGAGIGAGVGALTTAVPALTAYLMPVAQRAMAQKQENLAEITQEESPIRGSNPYAHDHLARSANVNHVPAIQAENENHVQTKIEREQTQPELVEVEERDEEERSSFTPTSTQ